MAIDLVVRSHSTLPMPVRLFQWVQWVCVDDSLIASIAAAITSSVTTTRNHNGQTDASALDARASGHCCSDIRYSSGISKEVGPDVSDSGGRSDQLRNLVIKQTLTHISRCKCQATAG